MALIKAMKNAEANRDFFEFYESAELFNQHQERLKTQEQIETALLKLQKFIRDHEQGQYLGN